MVFKKDISRDNIIKVNKIYKLVKKLKRSLGYSFKYYNINSFSSFDFSSEILCNNEINLRRLEGISLDPRTIANS